MRPKLIVFTGLPGAGKSAVAEAVGNKLNIPVFAKDWLEAPILRRGVAPGEQLGAIGYDLLTTLARRQLALDQSVILDSVASTSTIRSTWKALADSYDVDWLVVECVCSDEDTHRARMADRQRAIPDWPELEWSDVERVRSYYEPWDEERLVLDSVDALADNIDRALDYVNGIHVRLATPDDAPIVRYIMLLAYAEYEGALPVDSGAHAETVADVAAAIREGGAVLASIDGVFAEGADA